MDDNQSSYTANTASITDISSPSSNVLSKLNISLDDTGSAVPHVLQRFFRHLRQGLFGLLFALQRKADGESLFLVLAIEVFELLQLLSFPFRRHAHFPWNEEHTNWFISFVSTFVPEAFIIGLILTDAFLVGYYFAQNQIKFLWTLRYLRFVCTLFMTILFIPVVSLFTSMLAFCGGDTHHVDYGSCWVEFMPIRSVVVIFVSLVYIFLSLTFAISIFEQDPTNKGEILSRPHSRIEVYNLFVKTILTIMFVLLEQDKTYHWVLIAFCLAGSYSMLFLYVWFLPFYRWNINLLRVSMMAIFSWATTCLLIVNLINDTQHNSITIMFFVVLPVVLLVSIYAMRLRRRSIVKQSITNSINPCVVELKARMILENHGFLFTKRPKESHVSTEKNSNQAETTSANVTLLETDKPDLKKYDEAMEEITALYAEAAKKIPHSSLIFLFWSNFALHHCNNKQRSLVVLEECLKRDPLVDEEFIAFRQRKLMSEENGSENMDMLEFIICETHFRKALKCEKRAVYAQSRFWSELSQLNPNLQNLYMLGSSINSDVNIADIHYAKAIQSNPRSANILKSYARFLQDVRNDAKRSEEVEERARQVDDLHRRAQSVNGSSMDVGMILSSGSSGNDTALVTINHHGIILSANGGVCRLFGYEKPQQLVGQNVSILVPPPFDKIHNQFLTKYMNVGQGNIIDKLRKIVGITADGYLVPMMLLVRQITYGVNATFLGIFKAVSEGTETHDYILMDSAGNMKAMSEKCSIYFAIEPQELQRQQVNITEIIENFEEVQGLMKAGSGYRMQLVVDEQAFELVCSLVSIEMAGQSVMMMRISNLMMTSIDSSAMKADIPLNFYVELEKLKSKEKRITTGKDEKKEKDDGGSKSKDSKKGSSSGNKKQRKDSVRTNSGSGSITQKRRKTLDSDSGSLVPPKTRLRHVGSSTSSNHSGDSGGRQSGISQASTALNRMLRVNFARRIESTSKRLAFLRKSIFIIFALISMLAIVINVINAHYLGLQTKNMEDILNGGNTAVKGFKLLQKLQVLQANRSSLSPAELASMRDDITSYAHSIEFKHFNMYNTSAYLEEYRRLFTQATLPAIDSNGVNLTFTQTSLNDALSTFVSQAALIAISDANIHLGHISTILINTLLQPLRELDLAYLTVFNVNAENIDSWVFVFSLVPLAGLYLVALIVIIVVFIKTNAEAKIVYTLFLDVPKEIIGSMQDNCVQRLSTMESNVDNVFTSSSSDGNKHSEQYMGIFNLEQSIKDANLVKKKDELNESVGLSKSKDRRGGYEFINMRSIIMKIATLTGLSATYFIVFSVFMYLYFVQVTPNAGHIIWSLQVEQDVQEIYYRFKMLYNDDTICWGANSVENRLSQLNEKIDQLKINYNRLYSGDKEITVDPYLEESALSTLFIDDAGEFPILFGNVELNSVTTEQCQDLLYGYGWHGLINSLDQFYQSSKDMYGVLHMAAKNNQAVNRSVPLEYETMALKCLPQYFVDWRDDHMNPFYDLGFTLVMYVQAICTAVIVVTMILFYLVVLRPAMKNIENEVANTPMTGLMGGNAIKSVTQARLPRPEYLEIEKAITSFLRSYYGHVFVPAYFSNKESFGDLDVIVAKPTNSNQDHFLPCGLPSQTFLAQPPISTKEYLRTSATSCSFEFQSFQVDITIVPSEAYLKSSLVLMSYSGLGMLFGACMRVKWSPEGFFVEAPEKFEEGKEWDGPIQLTDDVREILDVFGLSYEAWAKGFRKEEDLWDWAAKSWVFEWSCVKETLRKILEKPMKREIVHRGWTYLSEKCPDKTIDGNLQAWHNQLIKQFDAQPKINALIAEKQRYNAFKSKFNGKLVTEWTGLTGKELGQFLIAFQAKHGDSKEAFMTFVEQQESLQASVLDLFASYKSTQT